MSGKDVTPDYTPKRKAVMRVLRIWRYSALCVQHVGDKDALVTLDAIMKET